MEVFLDLIKSLILLVIIVIALSPLCERMDKIIFQLESIEQAISGEEELMEDK